MGLFFFCHWVIFVTAVVIVEFYITASLHCHLCDSPVGSDCCSVSCKVVYHCASTLQLQHLAFIVVVITRVIGKEFDILGGSHLLLW